MSKEKIHIPTSYIKESFLALKKNKSALFGFIILLFLITFALFGPLISSHSYKECHLSQKNLPPSTLFWFGTDDLGRDMFTRTAWGARISLFVGVVAALIDCAFGVIYGALSGYLGGKTDEIMMRLADIFYSIPYLIVVILLMVAIGPGIWTIILALTLTGWIGMARIVRSQILYLKKYDFVMAARALGASPLRILFHHLIPNCAGSIITTITLTIPSAIFAEAFLSFLGLGVSAPIASWGTMAHDGLGALECFPLRLFFPAGFISITILSFNLLGDGLRDALDPRLH